jgi:hypothetical protein
MSGEKEIRGPLSDVELNAKYGDWSMVFDLNLALLAERKQYENLSWSYAVCVENNKNLKLQVASLLERMRGAADLLTTKDKGL